MAVWAGFRGEMGDLSGKWTGWGYRSMARMGHFMDGQDAGIEWVVEWRDGFDRSDS